MFEHSTLLNCHFFTTENPLLLFTAEVTPNRNARGPLELTVAPVDGLSAMLGRWVDDWAPTEIYDKDPGSTRIVTPAIVNVIPTPALLTLLAMADISAARRTR